MAKKKKPEVTIEGPEMVDIQPEEFEHMEIVLSVRLKNGMFGHQTMKIDPTVILGDCKKDKDIMQALGAGVLSMIENTTRIPKQALETWEQQTGGKDEQKTR